MDVLGHLVELACLQPSLDMRCRLAGAYDLKHGHAERGVVPFHLVLSGRCRLRVGGRDTVALAAGDFLMLPRGHAHVISGLQSSGADLNVPRETKDRALPLRENSSGVPDADFLCGHFDVASAAYSLLLSMLPDVFHVSLSAALCNERLRLLVSLLREEADSDLQSGLTIANTVCGAIFALPLRATTKLPLETPGLLSLVGKPRFAAALAAMINDPAGHWTIDRLASLSAMSRATYARHFTETSGMTVADFLAEIRMANAGQLLACSGRSVAEIGKSVGYGSEAAFSRAFKARRGLTPAQFRRNNVGA